MKRKIPIIIGIITVVAVAVLAFAGVFLWMQKSQITNYKSQTQNSETVDWKTYRNEEIGFEIKYPNEQEKLSVSTYGSKSCNTLFYEFVKNGGVIDAPDLPYIKVDLKSLSEIVTKDNLTGYKTTWTYSNPTGNKMFDLTIANFRNEKTCLVAEIFLSNSEFSSEYNHESAKSDEILSTFKFTK